MYKLKQKRAKKLIIQHYLKGEYTPTHHHREHNVLGIAQASFRAKFKAASNKLGQKRQPPKCFKDITRSAIYCKIQIINQNSY